MDKSKEIMDYDSWCKEREVIVRYTDSAVIMKCGVSKVEAPTLIDCIHKINTVELKLKKSQGDLFEPGNNLVDKEGNLLLF